MPIRRKQCVLPAAAAVLVALTGCGAGHRSTPAASTATSPAATAQASRSHCGAGWTHAQAGSIQVQVRNTDVNAEEVYLADAAGKLYGEIDPLAPGTAATLRTAVSAGSYHLVCSVNDGTPALGPTVTVTGAARGVRGVLPVTSADLVPAVISYQRWVQSRLQVLQGQVRALTTALRSGNRGAAQSAWQTANRTWNTMGGAYAAFGDIGNAVAGTAAPFPSGVHDAHWTGLLRIEYGLWHGQSPASLTGLGTTLEGDLNRLGTQLKTTQFQPLDVVHRAHEITEDTLQQTVTGHDDYGAHTQLSDALAQLDGTTELLTHLHPLLAPRYPQLPTVDSWIAKSRKDIQAQSTWTSAPTDAPPGGGHQLVDSDIAQLAELLTPVPTILEPRVTAP